MPAWNAAPRDLASAPRKGAWRDRFDRSKSLCDVPRVYAAPPWGPRGEGYSIKTMRVPLSRSWRNWRSGSKIAQRKPAPKSSKESQAIV